MITYNGAWSILMKWIRAISVRLQSDFLNTTESVLPVRDNPYHTNRRKTQKGVMRVCPTMHEGAVL